MFIHYGVYGFIRKYKLLSAIYGDRSFDFCKSSIRGAHSLHQFKPRKPFRQIHGNMKKSDKPAKGDVSDPKVYMRHTVANISKILRNSTWDSAEEQLQRFPVKWDSYTVNQVLKTHPPMEKAWLFFNWASGVKGFKHDQFTYTTMMDIFGEAGRIPSMNFVFQQMHEKGIKIDAVTYTSLLHWLSKAGDVDGAVKAWTEMNDKGFRPTVVSYTAYLKVLFDNNRVKEATDIYKEMVECGCSPNCYTYTVLMDYLAASGKYEAVLEIFSKMQETGVQPDKATCNILVERCSESGETWAMAQVLQYMKANSLVLRYPVYLKALETFKIAGQSDVLLRQANPHFSNNWSREGGTVRFEETASGRDSSLDRQLVRDLFIKQKFVAIDYLLAEASNKNVQLNRATISDIILLNCAHCRASGALLGYEYGLKMGTTVGKAEFLALIGVFFRTNTFLKAVEIVEEMARVGITPGIYLGALLIYKLGCARKPASAAKIFKLLPDDQKCAATYTALIGAYCFVGSVDKGLKIFATMQRKGIGPALGTYSVLLAGLEKRGRVSEAETLRKEKKKLQASFRFQDVVPMGEKICDLLFAGDGMP